MFEIIFNTIVINFFLLFSISFINLKYFKLNNLIFTNLLFYHLILTSIYIFFFKHGAADYKTYLNLTTFNGFSLKALVSADLITTLVAILKICFLNDLNIILLFSLLSLSGIIIFYKNLLKLGLEKNIAIFFLFIPGIHFWTCVPGKDSLILFFLAIFFYFYIEQRKFLSFIFILLVFLIRPHIGFIFFASVIITEFFLIRGLKKIIFLSILLFIFYFVINLDMVRYFFLDEKILSENIIVQIISNLNNFTNKFTYSDTGYEPNNFLFNIFSYIIFPIEFIFTENSFVINSTIMIESLTFLIIIHLISRSKKSIFLEKELIYFLMTCCTIYLLIMPQALFNFGLNVRQKWMIVPFLIYLIFLTKNLLVTIKNK